MNCTVYGKQLEDLVLTLQASGKEFFIPSDRLMVKQGFTYPCELMVYDSGLEGVLGDTFL